MFLEQDLYVPQVLLLGALMGSLMESHKVPVKFL